MRDLAFNARGARLATVDFHSVKVWDLANNKELATFSDDKLDGLERLASVAFSPDGTTVVSCSMTGRLRFHDAGSLRVVNERALDGKG